MPTTTNRKLRVFLCHSSQDKPIVRELYQRLDAEGWIDPWLDEEKLLPGQDWDMKIKNAIESADVAIVCLSNNSINKRGYVQKELKFALDVALEMPADMIFIIPMRLEDCPVPSFLKKWQWVDYFSEVDRKRAHKRLLDSLKLRAKSIGVDSSKSYLMYYTDVMNSIEEHQKDSSIPVNNWPRKKGMDLK